MLVANTAAKNDQRRVRRCAGGRRPSCRRPPQGRRSRRRSPAGAARAVPSDADMPLRRPSFSLALLAPDAVRRRSARPVPVRTAATRSRMPTSRPVKGSEPLLDASDRSACRSARWQIERWTLLASLALFGAIPSTSLHTADGAVLSRRRVGSRICTVVLGRKPERAARRRLQAPQSQTPRVRPVLMLLIPVTAACSPFLLPWPRLSLPAHSRRGRDGTHRNEVEPTRPNAARRWGDNDCAAFASNDQLRSLCIEG